MSCSIDDRPHCLYCKTKMLSGIAEPIVAGYALRNFECPNCGNAMRLVAEAKPNQDANKSV